MIRSYESATPHDGTKGTTAMNLERWSTRSPLDTGFCARWSDAVGRAPLANFSMLLDCVRFEAQSGRHSLLVLAEQEQRLMAIVLRESAGELHSGWPWRWQAVFCDTASPDELSPSPCEAALLFRAAQAASEGVRLRVHLPVDPGARTPGFRTGATIIQRLDVSDEDLVEGMDPNKRRLLRRAIREGLSARAADQGADYRAYAALDREATCLRGGTPTAEVTNPAPGEDWREWEHPWMRLFVAEREGRAEGFLGDAFAPGAIVDGRAAVSTPEGRKSGVMALLCHHEARTFRNEGHRWFNHGGDTTFKREVSGELGRRLVMFSWLGGGRRHELANRASALYHRSRPTLAGWVRAANRSFAKVDRHNP